jgi:drug/metabolite transporter (DMT)-like permease
MAIARTTAWVVTFVITWTVPLLGVVAMAWACEHHTRQLGHSGRQYYTRDAGPAEAGLTLRASESERAHSRRRRAGVAVLTAALMLLVALFAFASQRTQTIFGVNWVGLAAVLVVAGIAIAARRRR